MTRVEGLWREGVPILSRAAIRRVWFLVPSCEDAPEGLRHMPRRNLYAIAMVGAISLVCWKAGQAARPKDDDVMEMYGVFVDAVEQVQSNYVRPVSRRELMESALRGMLSDLDPALGLHQHDAVAIVQKADRREVRRFGNHRRGGWRTPTGSR